MRRIVKRIIVIFLILFILLILVWRIDRAYFHPYIPDYDLQIHDDVTTLKFTVPKDKDGCEARGGVWKKMGPRPSEECNLPTKDSGKPCSGSNECEGVCLADLSKEKLREAMKGRMFKTQGKCSAYIKVMGCRAYVYQGWARVICAD